MLCMENFKPKTWKLFLHPSLIFPFHILPSPIHPILDFSSISSQASMTFISCFSYKNNNICMGNFEAIYRTFFQGMYA